MRRLLLLGAAILGVVSSSSEARSAENSSERGDADSDAAATALVKLAAQQYDQGRLDEAVRTLEGARAISDRPAILYDIGQVQRARKDCGSALEAYRHFVSLTSPSDPNHDRAQRWQAEMQACVDEKAAAVPLRVTNARGRDVASSPLALAAPQAPDPRASLLTGSSPHPTEDLRISETIPPPTPQRNGSVAKVVGWSLLAAGAVVGIAAMWLELKAHGIESDLGSSPHSPEVSAERRREGDRDARWAMWTGICGGALAVSGGVVLVLGREPGTATRTTTTSLGWAGGF